MTKTKRITASILGVAMAAAINLASADVVVVEGYSPSTGNPASDKERAINNAVKTALLGAGGHVQSNTVVSNGQVASDTVSLQSSGRINSMKVLEEWQVNGAHHVKVEVDIHPAPACGNEGRYGKKVWIAAMQREHPDTAVIGDLANVDQELSRLFAQRIYQTYAARIADASHAVPPGDGVASGSPAQFSPAQFSPALSPAVVLDIAKAHASQFVLTGSVLDMSMADPEKYRGETFITKTTNLLTHGASKLFGRSASDYRLRNLAFRILLYDGVSGALLFDKTYQGQGVWDLPYGEKTGFATPAFWNTDYGKRTDYLINLAMNDVGTKLQCQPFMLNVEYLPADKKIYLPAGVNQGIKTGDMLALYFKKNRPLDADHGKAGNPPVPFSLEDLKANLTVTQVYPDYSFATASVELFEHYPYMAVAW